MMWRLRTILRTEVIVEPDVIENNNYIYKLFKIRDSNGNLIGENIRFLDIIYKNKIDDIFDAFAILYEELNLFIDKIAFITYGCVFCDSIVSICPDKVSINEKFEIAFHDFSKKRKTKNFNLNYLKDYNELSFENKRLIRLFRN
jgi:acetyltransferase-like isoleucine patch superfamily enzyme